MSMSAAPRLASGEVSPGSRRIGRRLTYCSKRCRSGRIRSPAGDVIGHARRADRAEVDGVELREPLEAVLVHHPPMLQVVVAAPRQLGERERDAAPRVAASSAARPAGMTSLPMPSPAMTAIL